MRNIKILVVLFLLLSSCTHFKQIPSLQFENYFIPVDGIELLQKTVSFKQKPCLAMLYREIQQTPTHFIDKVSFAHFLNLTTSVDSFASEHNWHITEINNESGIANLKTLMRGEILHKVEHSYAGKDHHGDTFILVEIDFPELHSYLLENNYIIDFINSNSTLFVLISGHNYFSDN